MKDFFIRSNCLLYEHYGQLRINLDDGKYVIVLKKLNDSGKDLLRVYFISFNDFRYENIDHKSTIKTFIVKKHITDEDTLCFLKNLLTVKTVNNVEQEYFMLPLENKYNVLNTEYEDVIYRYIDTPLFYIFSETNVYIKVTACKVINNYCSLFIDAFNTNIQENDIFLVDVTDETLHKSFYSFLKNSFVFYKHSNLVHSTTIITRQSKNNVFKYTIKPHYADNSFTVIKFLQKCIEYSVIKTSKDKLPYLYVKTERYPYNYGLNKLFLFDTKQALLNEIDFYEKIASNAYFYGNNHKMLANYDELTEIEAIEAYYVDNVEKSNAYEDIGKSDYVRGYSESCMLLSRINIDITLYKNAAINTVLLKKLLTFYLQFSMTNQTSTTTDYLIKFMRCLFYVANKDIVKIGVLRNIFTKAYVAKVLLWNTEQNVTVMDRRYATTTKAINTLYQIGVEKNYVIKNNENVGLGKTSKNLKHTVKIKNTAYLDLIIEAIDNDKLKVNDSSFYFLGKTGNTKLINRLVPYMDTFECVFYNPFENEIYLSTSAYADECLKNCNDTKYLLATLNMIFDKNYTNEDLQNYVNLECNDKHKSLVNEININVEHYKNFDESLNEERLLYNSVFMASISQKNNVSCVDSFLDKSNKTFNIVKSIVDKDIETVKDELNRFLQNNDVFILLSTAFLNCTRRYRLVLTEDASQNLVNEKYEMLVFVDYLEEVNNNRRNNVVLKNTPHTLKLENYSQALLIMTGINYYYYGENVRLKCETFFIRLLYYLIVEKKTKTFSSEELFLNYEEKFNIDFYELILYLITSLRTPSLYAIKFLEKLFINKDNENLSFFQRLQTAYRERHTVHQNKNKIINTLNEYLTLENNEQ